MISVFLVNYARYWVVIGHLKRVEVYAFCLSVGRECHGSSLNVVVFNVKHLFDLANVTGLLVHLKLIIMEHNEETVPYQFKERLVVGHHQRLKASDLFV